MKTKIFAIAALASAVATANAAVLWDNNLITNGFNGRAVSPPAFPNIRVVDDINVTGAGWWVNKVLFNILEDTAWVAGNTVDIYFYVDSNNDGVPDTNNANWTGMPFTRTFTGQSYFGRPDYIHEVNVGQLLVLPGRYWIGLRHPNASGSGTGYWMTSDGGPDGAGTSTGYFSLDGGSTWQPEGTGWQHAFRIEGEIVPEPGTMLAIGAGLAALAARRRRK